jgi:hypothetical protein
VDLLGIVSRIRSILLSILQGMSLYIDHIDASTREIASGAYLIYNGGSHRLRIYTYRKPSFVDIYSVKIALRAPDGSIIKVVEVDGTMIPRAASVKGDYVEIDLDIVRGVVVC